MRQRTKAKLTIGAAIIGLLFSVPLSAGPQPTVTDNVFKEEK